MDVNRSINSCRYMLTQVVGNTNAHRQIQYLMSWYANLCSYIHLFIMCYSNSYHDTLTNVLIYTQYYVKVWRHLLYRCIPTSVIIYFHSCVMYTSSIRNIY